MKRVGIALGKIRRHERIASWVCNDCNAVRHNKNELASHRHDDWSFTVFTPTRKEKRIMINELHHENKFHSHALEQTCKSCAKSPLAS